MQSLKKLLALLGVLLSLNALSQLTWTTVAIPMRDSTHTLAADYYVPPGCTSCPVILIQTPYNKNWYHASLPLGIGNDLSNSDYAFVIVDWRGFNGSLPALTPNPNRGEDGYDCIEWISQQPWCDGNIGTWGPSALGVVQYQTAREQHPNHKCAVPLVADPITKYEDYYEGGVYRTEYLQQLDALGYGLSATVLANPVKNATWTFLQNSTTYPADISIPFFMIGGWFDHNVDGMLEFFDLLKTQSPVSVRDKHKLLMGPWCHGGSGTAYVGSLQQGEWQFPNAAGLNDSLALEFFDYYLRGDVTNDWTVFDNYDSYEFETGYGAGNFDLRDSTVLSPSYFYLNPNGILNGIPGSPTGDTTIVYDPRDPSPTVGGPTLRTDLDQGPYDQSLLVESRNDIAKFSTYPIVCPSFHIYGKAEVHLFVSSDQKDTDFAARLTISPYNDPQKSMLIADGIKRLRFRNGYTANDTAVGVPGQIYEVIIEFPHISHAYGGEVIHLDITSSNYPRFDKNLNNGDSMYTAGDTLVANNTIYYNSSYPSYLKLPVSFIGGVLDNPQSQAFVVYPNPSSDFIHFNLPVDDKWKFNIIDITGKSVSNSKIQGKQFSIGIEGLATGIYLIRAENRNGEIYQSKFIKN